MPLPMWGDPLTSGQSGRGKLKGNFKGGRSRTGYILSAAQKRAARQNVAKYNARQIRNRLKDSF